MNDLTINISKEYKCDAKTLFLAVGEGILFKYTGALMDKLKMDFREGGELVIDWGDSSMTGNFTAIKPYNKIAFTWNFHSPETNKQMSTLVTITIKEVGGKSLLTLVVWPPRTNPGPTVGFGKRKGLLWQENIMQLKKSSNIFEQLKSKMVVVYP